MSPAAEPDDTDAPSGTQRLDKWLWFARVIKTRTQAAGLVTDGKVRVNRLRVDKPSVGVRQGDVVTVTVRGHVRVLKVVGPGVRRGPPAEARTLFEEIPTVRPAAADGGAGATASPASSVQGGAGQRAQGQGRPTKRDRRQIDRLKRDDRP